MCNRITLKQAVEKFPDYILLEGNTESTIKAYSCDIKQFYSYMRAKYPNIVYIDSLKRNHISDYLLSILKKVKAKKCSCYTYDRKADSLIVFCKYIFENGYSSDNLLKSYKRKRMKNRYFADFKSDFQPYIFTEEELSKLINTIMDSNDQNKDRDLAIFMMLIQLGIRRSTLLEACWEDVSFEKKEMTLHHVKDQISTRVKITQELSDVLENYQFISGRKTGKIFISNEGNPLSKSAYNDVIRKYLKKIGAYQKGATGHSFRHTFITNAVRKNINAARIMRYTGHRDFSSLKPYLHLAPDDLNDVCVAVYSPLLVDALEKSKMRQRSMSKKI
ncbi:conserved protein of unknown function [Ruminococcaceae bacterium BL-6]|jgi:integrase/recombinase XerD|nr:conserved protein of unknown function [Ruminococcaceae bacterium BL-6]HBG55951.1 hypothetical protein [Oscillospiraceae bacterium]